MTLLLKKNHSWFIYELDKRCLQYPRKILTDIVCPKSLDYWLTRAVWPQMTSDDRRDYKQSFFSYTGLKNKFRQSVSTYRGISPSSTYSDISPYSIARGISPSNILIGCSPFNSLTSISPYKNYRGISFSCTYRCIPPSITSR